MMMIQARMVLREAEEGDSACSERQDVRFDTGCISLPNSTYPVLQRSPVYLNQAWHWASAHMYLDCSLKSHAAEAEEEEGVVVEVPVAAIQGTPGPTLEDRDAESRTWLISPALAFKPSATNFELDLVERFDG